MDDKDILLLQILHDRPASIHELKDAIRVNSVATVHSRLVTLERNGFISPPPQKKMARSRVLTEKGIMELRARRLIK